jgi:hypothetical protein
MTAGTFASSVVGALGLSVAFATSGYAADTLYHGSLCNPQLESQGLLLYNDLGVYNISGLGGTPPSYGQVHCGSLVDPTSTIRHVSVLIYDVNPDRDMDVVCTLAAVNAGGVAVFKEARSSPIPASGQQQLLSFDFDPGQTNVTIHLMCNIPPAKPASGPSRLFAYAVSTQ